MSHEHLRGSSELDPFKGEALAEGRNVILGTGSALPSKCVTNADLSEFLDTSDAWIEERVGILKRYVCTGEEATVSLAVAASEKAIEAAGIDRSEIDLVVFGTFTPDKALPSAGALLAERLGLADVAAFDIQAACSGFLFSLATAEALMTTMGAQTALIIGADTLSRVVDWEDRNTAVLFGDGAGACILRRPHLKSEPMILSSFLRTFSEGAQLITCEEIERRSAKDVCSPLDARQGKGPYLQMKGKSVFKAGVQLMTASILEVLKDAQMSIEDVSLFIPHQSNIRMIDMVAQNIGLSGKEKIATTIDSVGNTSAASIPITLDSYVREGRVRRGDNLLLTSVGSGITYGSLLIRW